MSNENPTAAEAPAEEAPQSPPNLLDLVKEGAFSLPEAEPQPETEEPQPEPDAEPQPEEVVEEDGGTDPPETEATPGWQKRIDKLTAQKHELNGEIQALKDQVARLQNGQQDNINLAQDQNPVAGATSFEELEQMVEQAESIDQWARKRLFRLNQDPESVEQIAEEIQKQFKDTPDDPATYLFELQETAQAIQRKHVPQARMRIQQQQYWQEEASKVYPWTADPTSEANATLEAVYGRIADKRVSEIPEAKMLLAHALSQIASLKKPRPKAGPPQEQPTQQPGKPQGAAPKKGKDFQSKYDAAAEKAKSGGGMAALIAMQKAANGIG